MASHYKLLGPLQNNTFHGRRMTSRYFAFVAGWKATREKQHRHILFRRNVNVFFVTKTTRKVGTRQTRQTLKR